MSWMALAILVQGPTAIEVEAQPLTQSSTGAEDPAILEAADGAIWVAWFDKDGAGKCHLWCRYTRDGKEWSAPAQITSNPQGDNWYPAWIQDREKNLCLTWWSGRTMNADIWFAVSSEGRTWSESIPITKDSGHDWCPAIAQTADGTYWIAWSSNRNQKRKDLWVSSSKDRTNWSAPECAIRTELSEDLPSLAPYGKGLVLAYCAYSDPKDDSQSLGNDSAEIYVVSSENGSTWTKPERVTENKSVDTLPTVVEDGRALFWTSNAQDPSGDTVGMRWTPGKKGRLYRIGPKAGEDYSPKAIRSKAGMYWIVWVSNRSGKRNIWIGSFRESELK